MIDIQNAEYPLDVKAPISVKPLKMENQPPPFDDYIPSEAKRNEPVSPIPNLHKMGSEEIVTVGSDYSPADVAAKIMEQHKERIKQRAKELYNADSAYREDYKKALKRIEIANADEHLNPADDLVKAKKIIETRRAPITKEQAMRRATSDLIAELRATTVVN